MDTKAFGTSFSSYVTYSSFGLYVRMGTTEITGFAERDWGGLYYAGATASPHVGWNMYMPVARSDYAAFEVRPWGWPIPYRDIAMALRLEESILRSIVGQVLTHHKQKIRLGSGSTH